MHTKAEDDLDFLSPLLVVPSSFRAMWRAYLPLVLFVFCLPAIVTSATTVSSKILFMLSFVFILGLSLNYSLHPVITLNHDQIILHHHNLVYLSAIMYQDISSLAVEKNFLTISTREGGFTSLPFSRRYWPRMKQILAERGVPIVCFSKRLK